MKDVTSLISLVYYGFDVNGNSIKRVVTKDVEPILLNGLKHQGLLYFLWWGEGVMFSIVIKRLAIQTIPSTGIILENKGMRAL